LDGLLCETDTMPVETERVTLRLPVQDLQDLDMLIQAGAFMNRSDAIRAAIKDFVSRRAPEVKQQLDARKTLMETVSQHAALKELAEQLKQQQETLNKLMQK
jgi:Arc/MetJ-type ribon-helix-helix transcriptional regulator